MSLTHGSPALYNALPDIFEADKRLNDLPRDRIIDPLLDVIRRFDLEDIVGIRLLHKHNLLSDGEVMAEDFGVDDLGFAMITRARAVSELSPQYVPNSWALSDKGFVPVEFSDSRLVADGNFNPQSHPDFFLALETVLRELGVTSLLGPSLLGSQFIEENRPAGHDMMIEFTALDDRANVLRFVPRVEAYHGGAAMETHWCATEEEGEGDKKVGTKTCTKICPPIQNPPRHQGTYVHKQD